MPDAKTVWQQTTLTGRTLEEVYARIDADLGKGAYSEIQGQAFKGTDIKPPFVYELLTECFGPCGIGWGFSVTEQEYLGKREYKAKSGRDVTEHGSHAAVVVWYSLDGKERNEWGPIPGGSRNEIREYAEGGAVTNAIGKAFSFLGVQRHIYKNEAAPSPAATDEQVKRIEELAASKADVNLDTALKHFGVGFPIDLTFAQAEKLIAALEKKADKKVEE